MSKCTISRKINEFLRCTKHYVKLLSNYYGSDDDIDWSTVNHVILIKASIAHLGSTDNLSPFSLCILQR